MSKIQRVKTKSIIIIIIIREADADRDQVTQYMAAVNHDGAGTLGLPIEECGSASEYTIKL